MKANNTNTNTNTNHEPAIPPHVAQAIIRLVNELPRRFPHEFPTHQAAVEFLADTIAIEPYLLGLRALDAVLADPAEQHALWR